MKNNNLAVGNTLKTEPYSSSLQVKSKGQKQLLGRSTYHLKLSGFVVACSVAALANKFAKKTFTQGIQKSQEVNNLQIQASNNFQIYAWIGLFALSFFYMADRLGRWVKEKEQNKLSFVQPPRLSDGNVSHTNDKFQKNTAVSSGSATTTPPQETYNTTNSTHNNSSRVLTSSLSEKDKNYLNEVFKKLAYPISNSSESDSSKTNNTTSANLNRSNLDLTTRLSPRDRQALINILGPTSSVLSDDKLVALFDKRAVAA